MGVRFIGEKSEALCLKELVPGSLTCPPPLPALARLGEFSSQGPVSNTSPSATSGMPPDLSRPLGFPSWAQKQDCGSPSPQRPGHSPDMQSLWQAASGRPGQRTERRRRSEWSRSRPEKRQKPAPEQAAWRWGGFPGWRAGPGWPALGGVRSAPALSESPSRWRLASCWSPVWAMNTGSCSLEG